MSTSSYEQPLKSVALVGTYLPRRCGVAVFNTELSQALAETSGSDCKVYAVAVNDVPRGYHYPETVRFEIAVNLPQDYRQAAEFLNMHEADAVIVQHEFGIYGGPAGSHILRLLRELHMPAVVVLHTVTDRPSSDHRRVVTQMAEAADRLVVMSDRARRMLIDTYDVDPHQVAVIPHGVPLAPRLQPDLHREDLGFAGRRVLLSFGLLSPDDGIEHMLRAMPAIIEKHPEALYVVLGETHPHVKVEQGEAYRQHLHQIVRDLDLADHVTFRSRFASQEELGWYLAAADLVVTPYTRPDQVASGTLARAMATGSAVISTPYWHAADLLADDRGRLVPFADPQALAQAAVSLLTDDDGRNRLAQNARHAAEEMAWPRVARQYFDVLGEALLDRGRRPRRPSPPVDSIGWSEIIPEPDFRHLRIMTDGTGLSQHAVYAIPDRRHGYCTDDNARALTVAMWQWELREDPSVRPLISTYLAFLVHAFNEQQRRFRNFMSYSREWLEQVGSEDSHARAVMALGITVDLSPHESTLGLAVRLFNDALPALDAFTSPRSRAFAIVGIDAYLRRFPGDTAARRMLDVLAKRLMRQFEKQSGPQWPWLEDLLAWGNARIPHGLLVASERLDSQKMRETALTCLQWQLDLQTTPAGHLSVIGNRGWYPRGGQRARFDQQPIEVMNLAEACGTAYALTHDRGWLVQIRRCLEWFLGRNDLGKPLYDFNTGGCRDGLHPAGVNANQGAESTLAWLTTLLIVHRLQISEALRPAEPPDGRLELQAE